MAGVAGAVCASLGVLSPTLLVCSIAAVMFEKFKDSDFMHRVMLGILPSCLGLIAGVLLSLALTNYATDAGTVSFAAVFIGVAGLILLLKYKVSIFKVILISAALGLLLVR